MTHLITLLPGIWLSEVHMTEIELDVRGVVLAGSRMVVVWDTLCVPADMAPVAELARGKETIAVYSHADWDHCWGTAGIAVTEVIAHTVALERFNTDVPETLFKMRSRQPQTWHTVELIPPTHTIEKNLTLDLGGLTLELHALPGHTYDSIVGFVPEAGLLLGGDAIEDPFPMLPDNGCLEKWIAELERWAADPRVITVIPAHGAVGGPELIERNLDYLRSQRLAKAAGKAG